MPELPEVEIITESLEFLVGSRVITSAEILRQCLAPDITPEDFSSRLKNAEINRVHRRGKHILFDLSNGNTLIVHLRMSGRFSLLAAERENPKFTHAIFNLNGNEKLVFDDQRHFGLMKLVPTPELYETRELKKLAPEPFSQQFSIEFLTRSLAASRRPLKEFLIDQTRVCGLGNIYSCEAMFAAGVDPRKPANRLSRKKVAVLHESIRAVLGLAIDHARRREVHPENLEGNYYSGSGEDLWLVYDRENLDCRNCKSPILRLKQGGRSTYFCRRCQRS